MRKGKNQKLETHLLTGSASYLSHFLNQLLKSPLLLNVYIFYIRYNTYMYDSDRFYFLGLQNPVDSECSHEIKGSLLLGRKAMTNLESILKSRDVTLLTKVHLVKAVIFPVVVYRCES